MRLIIIILLIIGAATISIFAYSDNKKIKYENIEYSEDYGLIKITSNNELIVKNKVVSNKVNEKSPIGVGNGRISFIDKQGHYSQYSNNEVKYSDIEVSLESSFVHLAFATIVNAKIDGKYRLARIEDEGRLFISDIRKDRELLSSSKPTLFHTHIAVLYQPSKDYSHNIYGEKYNHKALMYVERHVLTDLVEPLILKDNNVFEENELRLYKDKLFTIISNDDIGARIALIDKNLKIIKLSTKTNEPYRWLSAFVHNDKIYSVVKPHIKGDLSIYDDNLDPKVIKTGISSHLIGNTKTNTSASYNNKLYIPTMNFEDIYLLEEDKVIKTKDRIKKIISTDKGIYYLTTKGDVILINN